jgi:hypothetical protein
LGHSLSFIKSWGLFILLVLSWIFFQPADLGDLIFLFVYENLLCFIGLLLFVLTNKLFQHFTTTKGSFWQKLKNGFDYSFGLSAFLIPYIFIIITVNQVSVEFLLSFFCNNGLCDLPVLNSFEQGMYFETRVIRELFQKFPMGYTSFTLFTIAFAFVNLSLDSKKNKSYTNNLFSVHYCLFLGIRAVAMCLSTLFICFTWIILKEFIVLNNNYYILMLIELKLFFDLFLNAGNRLLVYLELVD